MHCDPHRTSSITKYCQSLTMDRHYSTNDMSTLCNLCRGVSLDEIIPAARYTHHASYASLEASAQDGCEICAAIILEISHSALLKDPITGRDTNQDFEFLRSHKSQIYLKLEEPVSSYTSCRKLLIISIHDSSKRRERHMANSTYYSKLRKENS